jgi:hypothetical protein
VAKTRSSRRRETSKTPRELSEAISWLFRVEGPNLSPAKTRRAWQTLAGSCGEAELYDRLGRVVLALVRRSQGVFPLRRGETGFGISRGALRRLTARMQKLASELRTISVSAWGRHLWPGGASFSDDIRRQAEFLNKVALGMQKRLGPKGLNVATQEEAALLRFVESKTGRFCFSEVATLLEAICLCGFWQTGRARHVPAYTADALERRFQRLKKHSPPQAS